MASPDAIGPASAPADAFRSGLHVFNSLSRKREEFVTVTGTKTITWCMYVMCVMMIIATKYLSHLTSCADLSCFCHRSAGEDTLSMDQRIWGMPERMLPLT
jgi:hypothetical protein